MIDQTAIFNRPTIKADPGVAPEEVFENAHFYFGQYIWAIVGTYVARKMNE